ncbi:MAG TPA: hypothetical protein VN710_14530 [Verrucomicrobiae bacterium]|nr:hypothetical protein [Verrucomicrobiae bacterium]
MAPLVSAAQDLSALFGSRVTANARYKAPLFTGDFDGDGTPDAAYLVTILPESAQDKLAGDVTVIGTQFGREPLGSRGEALALAIVQKSGRQKYLLTGYDGEGVSDFFGSPMWGSLPPPIDVARRGSKAFRTFQAEEPGIKHDILVVGTEAGIDTALFWNGQSYVLFSPAEEP